MTNTANLPFYLAKFELITYMRVLIVSGGKPTKKYPFIGNFAFEQAVALADSGTDVTFFGIDLRSFRRKRPYGISYGVAGKVRWYVISIPIGAVPLSLLCFIGAKALSYLYSKVYKNRKKPDIVHAHFTEIGQMAASLVKKIDVPLVITEHSSAMNCENVNESLQKFALKGYKMAARVVAVSHPLSQNIKRYTGIDAIVIPNMIKLDVFCKCEHRAHKGYRFVTTGLLIERKRTLNTIKAIEAIHRLGYNVHLDVIGDGHLRSVLMEYVWKHDLHDIVMFHGILSPMEIVKVYEECDCFVLPSAGETFGVVYVEAMAAGLPVIATRCGGPEDFVNEDNGILIDVDDAEQLQNAFLSFMNAPKHCSPTRLRDYAKENYGPEQLALRLNRLYKEIYV